jgi:hypothetical protein
MSSITSIVSYTLLAFIVVWFILILTVLKPGEESTPPPAAFNDGVLDRVPQSDHRPTVQKSAYVTKQRKVKSGFEPTAKPDPSKASLSVPLSSEWLFIRSVSEHGKPQVAAPQPVQSQKQQVQVKPKPKPVQAAQLVLKPIQPQPGKPANELSWPPVQNDGNPAAEDGFDVMPLINIKVPRFFMPKTGEDFNKVGSKVHGEETIFLMIASYRDFQCRETITSAYMRADHPERLFIGAVDQVVPGDIGCLDIDIPCSQDPSQMICKYRDQISVYKMDAQYATGPVTARHVGDRMYRGEYFVMQMDAHCQFVRHWDKLIIDQWRSTHNEMAVLR